MSPTLLLALGPMLDRAVRGREVAGVRPARRTGLHVLLRGEGQGLRLDTAPRGGAVVLTGHAPERTRGGRGAWTEAAAVGDKWFAGRRLESCVVATDGRSLELRLSPAGLIRLDIDRGRALVSVHESGERPRSLPQADASAPDDRLQPLTPFTREHAERIEALAAAGHATTEGLMASLPGLGRRAASELAADEGRLRSFAARLCGEEFPAVVVGPPGWDPEGAARASWAGRLSVDPLLSACPADSAACRVYPTLAAAVESWHDAASRAEALAQRRLAVARALESERRRADRAREAVQRDAANARDPDELARTAEALLAGGTAVRPAADGSLEVPDPYRPGETLRVRVDPPGASPPQIADRLYGRARRERRGIEARARRKADLTARIEALDAALALTRAAEDVAQIDAAEAGAARLGLSLSGLAPPRPGVARARRRQPERPARSFRSPAGLEVLVGRTSRQNDALTFRVAAPEDLWLHVRDLPGAHVIVRLAGRRDAPEPDVLFAAGLAAAFSRAPAGEQVEVHVARRKHVRRRRGGAPGEVLVKRSRTVRVRVPEPPAAD